MVEGHDWNVPSCSGSIPGIASWMEKLNVRMLVRLNSGVNVEFIEMELLERFTRADNGRGEVKLTWEVKLTLLTVKFSRTKGGWAWV